MLTISLRTDTSFLDFQVCGIIQAVAAFGPIRRGFPFRVIPSGLCKTGLPLTPSLNLEFPSWTSGSHIVPFPGTRHNEFAIGASLAEISWLPSATIPLTFRSNAK